MVKKAELAGMMYCEFDIVEAAMRVWEARN